MTWRATRSRAAAPAGGSPPGELTSGSAKRARGRSAASMLGCTAHLAFSCCHAPTCCSFSLLGSVSESESCQLPPACPTRGPTRGFLEWPTRANAAHMGPLLALAPAKGDAILIDQRLVHHRGFSRLPLPSLTFDSPFHHDDVAGTSRLLHSEEERRAHATHARAPEPDLRRQPQRADAGVAGGRGTEEARPELSPTGGGLMLLDSVSQSTRDAARPRELKIVLSLLRSYGVPIHQVLR